MSPAAGSADRERSGYDRLSNWYDLLSEPWERPFREKGVKMLSVRPGERVLEIGYGTGHALAHLATQVGPSGQTWGVDASSGMAAVARQSVSVAGSSDRAVLTCGDARALPLRTQGFDAAFMCFTLELFETSDITRVLTGVRRVLRANGRLCVVSLARRHPPGRMERVYRWAHRTWPEVIDCRPIEAAVPLGEAGFDIECVERGSMAGLGVDITMGRLGL